MTALAMYTACSGTNPCRAHPNVLLKPWNTAATRFEDSVCGHVRENPDAFPVPGV